MSDLDAAAVGEPPPPYIIFLVVFLFFLTGLLGFLVCHLLKKKGYRCRTGDMDDEEEEDEEEKKQGTGEDEDEENEDTVEQILKCIIENEANMEAFKEMLGNQNVCALHDPRLLRKESLGGVPPHHHTVHSGSDRNSCHLCVQGRTQKNRRRSRTPRAKQRPGEQTVFSVGRFRVIHTDKKLHGSPHPLADSGDQMNQSQDSKDNREGVADPKEGGYNLRNMFKDVKQPTESVNGMVSNVGKRRKSVTIFGLGRRGSDPVGVKTSSLPGGWVVGGGRETGVKFSQNAPVVLEEQLQMEDPPENPRTEPDIGAQTKGLETGSAKNSEPDSATLKGYSELLSSSNPGPTPSDELKKASSVCAEAGDTKNIPSSLPVPTSFPSGRSLKSPTPGTQGEEEKIMGQVYSPGPRQTSTPIAPGLGVVLGLTTSVAAPQPQTSSSAGFLPSGTVPSPNSSRDVDPGIGASLASITIGSSPSSPFPIKTPSLVSLKTPTSPAMFMRSHTPPHDARNTPTQAVKTPSSSPALKHSPQLSSVLRKSNQSPTTSLRLGRSPSPLLAHTPSPALNPSPKPSAMPMSPTPSASQKPPVTLSPGSPQMSPRDGSPHVGMSKIASVTSVTMPKGDTGKTPTPPMGHKGKRTFRMNDTVEMIERGGVLETDKPMSGDVQRDSLASPSTLLIKDGLRSQPVSPGRPPSPSFPLEGRISSVAIVKASPDSKREFSVVTMLEEPSGLTSREEETNIVETYDLTEVVEAHPNVSEGGAHSSSGQTKTPDNDLPTVPVVPTVSQEKDDIVEMEDIKDCNVKQYKDRKGDERDDGGVTTVHSPQKQD